MRYLRSLLPLALCAAFGVAHAQISFSSVNATYSMNPPTGSINWLQFPNGGAGTFDFVQNAPAFKVGDSTLFTDGTSTITYNVTSANNINGFDLLMQGDVEKFGRVQFTIGATGGSGSLGSVSSSILGSSWGSGGVDGAFTKIYHISFSQPSNSFTVTQTLAIDINGQSVPSPSVALVALVEHNFPVPEPSAMVGLTLGASALIARRRRQR